MRTRWNYLVLGATSIFSSAILCAGWLSGDALYTAGGAIGLCYVAWRLASASRGSPSYTAESTQGDRATGRRPGAGPSCRTNAKASPTPATAAPQRPAAAPKPVAPGDTQGLVQRMLAQGRFALLLRPQIAANLSEGHLGRAQEALERAMSLVPDGEVALGQLGEGADDGGRDEQQVAAAQPRVVQVERFFLDRFPVTNQQFYEFVADGGYQQVALWDQSIWPAVLDFVDRTGMPGPRFWKNGCFLPGEENHPVVGVSWYEAGAYARWVGKRLPTDAEWVKAGTWPVRLSPATRMHRKYPWGDTMDRKRANLWRSKASRIVPVDQFAEGVSVGGVYQLIGNVWEWTSGNFRPADHPAGTLELPTPMKSIRGGAYDTYFDNQATCQFQSGENPLRRRHNVGFRCALGVCDLVLPGPMPNQQEPGTDEQAAPMGEEVHS